MRFDDDVLVRVRTNWKVVVTHVDWLDVGQRFEILKEVVCCGRNDERPPMSRRCRVV